MKVLVLGAGKMVESILLGLIGQQDFSQWFIYSPSGLSAKKLAESIGAKYLSSLSNEKYDLIFIGCKPQQLTNLAKDFQEQFKSSTIVSLLAAITESEQCRILGAHKLVRVMPNLPVKFREGVSLISSRSTDTSLVREIFSKLGMAIVLEESELEELTLLTGSGPALFYEFAQNLASSFSSLDQAEREKLVKQVLIGSAISIKNESSALSSMIDSVTSKGGVTIAVLEGWRELKLIDGIKKGVLRGLKRTAELKAILLQN
ncbi:MAG: pyrroline-5-carboxylate reductase family protein [Bacteriovoracaceae bacterium]